MKTTKDTPKQVADSVRRNLYRRQTLTSIGRMFDVSPERVCQVLDGTSYLSAKWAQRFADAFGFNIIYLISGEGDLITKDNNVSAELAREYCALRDLMDESRRKWENIKNSSVFSEKEKNAALRQFNTIKIRYGKISRRFYSEIDYVGFATSEETRDIECANRELKDLLRDINAINNK